MRKSICSIVLGLLGSLAAPVAAQPGQAPVMPPQPQPYAEPQPQPYGQPQPQPAQPLPPGASRATFVSMGEARWDVRLDDNAVCTTPCTVILEPMRFVTLHSHERAPTRLPVGHLPPGDVLVQAKPRAQGAFATGVTFTTLSGMGLATGITLTAVGYGTDRSGMRTAGLITGVASAIGLYLSIDLLRRSLPRVYVGPAQAVPYAAGNTVGLAGRF
ncbi:MAG TPA: hypothetical protein VK932_07125 [Kofleriaceae bacterium]|nr:hypothetical protein [Kofleriaceae bacterium]